jgi:hypothetical protein
VSKTKSNNEDSQEETAAADGKHAAAAAAPPGEAKPHCGIVMPISEIDGCSTAHWIEVKSILIDALQTTGFTADLVSEAEDVGTIHKRIIQHLHDDPLVICDVSGKNSNVMFELGLRLAFDKPTIIVKDDKTGYSFDTSPIEHLTYPRDLRFGRIVDFKRELANKARATFEAGKKSSYSTFLKHFGPFTVARIETKEVGKEQYALDQLAEIRALLYRIASERERATPADPSLFTEGVPSASRRTVLRIIHQAVAQAKLPDSPEWSSIADQIHSDIRGASFASVDVRDRYILHLAKEHVRNLIP